MAVAISVAWGVVAFLSIHQGSFQAFVWLVNLITTAGLISWVILCVTYLRFFYGLRRQGISRSQLPYCSPFQPYLAVSNDVLDSHDVYQCSLDQYYALVMNVLILLFSGWTSFVGGFNASSFLSNYLNWFVLFP
jgi:amino acid transporter